MPAITLNVPAPGATAYAVPRRVLRPAPSAVAGVGGAVLTLNTFEGAPTATATAGGRLLIENIFLTAPFASANPVVAGQLIAGALATTADASPGGEFQTITALTPGLLGTARTGSHSLSLGGGFTANLGALPIAAVAGGELETATQPVGAVTADAAAGAGASPLILATAAVSAAGVAAAVLLPRSIDVAAAVAIDAPGLQVIPFSQAMPVGSVQGAASPGGFLVTLSLLATAGEGDADAGASTAGPQWLLAGVGADDSLGTAVVAVVMSAAAVSVAAVPGGQAWSKTHLLSAPTAEGRAGSVSVALGGAIDLDVAGVGAGSGVGSLTLPRSINLSAPRVDVILGGNLSPGGIPRLRPGDTVARPSTNGRSFAAPSVAIPS